jgi:hypothetical protein
MKHSMKYKRAGKPKIPKTQRRQPTLKQFQPFMVKKALQRNWFKEIHHSSPQPVEDNPIKLIMDQTQQM